MPHENENQDSTEVTESEAIETEVTEEETPSENGEESESTSTKTDYKALYEEERQRAEAAQKAAAKESFKARQVKREEPEEVSQDDEDKPLTKKDLQALLLRERQETKRELQNSRIREIVGKLAESEDEARYITEIHKNRVWPDSVSLEEQIEEAHAIANRKRLIAKNAELGRALKGSFGTQTKVASTQRESQVTQPKVKADLSASLKRAGFAFDSKVKQWTKKMPNGTYIYKDLKTGRILPL